MNPLYHQAKFINSSPDLKFTPQIWAWKLPLQGVQMQENQVQLTL